MEKEGKGAQEVENPEAKSSKKTRIVIGVPSYQEVIESSKPKSTPPSLFTPSQSFSQAFSFLKSSEFYSPPPPSAAASVPSTSSQPYAPAPLTSSQVGKPNVASSSSPALSAGYTSATAVGSSSSNYTQNRNAIIVSHRQKGNPLLKYIRNVRWTFADIVCDYVLGQNSCALYLSIRYHLLHPDYLYYRIRELQKNFKLRVVLCHVDVEDVVKPLLEITKTALLHDCTLLCAWSLEECARYLETIKVYENKPADLIQGHMDTDYLSRLNHALTSVRHINKTDVVTLGSTFGSISNIMDASMEDLARCPGIGERKVKRLYDTFHEPFKRVRPSCPAVLETSVKKDAPSSTSEAAEEEDKEEASKPKKKEPEAVLKSALSTAFAKYADKIGKKKSKSHDSKEGETMLTTDNVSEVEIRKSREGAQN